MDPEELIIEGNEYIVAQLTLPKSLSYDVILNVQGKNKINQNNHLNYPTDNFWREEHVVFHITSNNQLSSLQIPMDCNSWYDGCNICNVFNGVIQSCTKLMCLINNNPHCLQSVDGH